MSAATDLGRFCLGDWVPITFPTVNSTRVPSWPTATPTIRTFDASDVTTVVETLRPPAFDMQRQTGLFRHWLRLSSTYAINKTYLAVATWTISGTDYADMFQWAVLPGGDADGAVIGAKFVSRPEANVVAYITDIGKLKTSNNPR